MLLLTEKIQNNQLEDSCDFSYQMEDLEFGCVEFFGGGEGEGFFFHLPLFPLFLSVSCLEEGKLGH